MTEVETIVEPDGVADDVGWESVPFISIHAEIVSQTELIWQYPCPGLSVFIVRLQIMQLHFGYVFSVRHGPIPQLFAGQFMGSLGYLGGLV
jgi:hypothetical protein